MEIGVLYGTSKLVRASCESKLTNVDFDLPSTIEGDHSQKSPGVYVNNGPSVSKAKVIVLGYSTKMQGVCFLSWMNYL